MPSTTAETEWDGVCACGKAEMDGKRCALGATHLHRPRCSVCGEPQFETPSGLTCANGHGGANSVETPSLEDLLA